METAFVTGSTGQIGSYITEILLQNNYIVYGLKRSGPVPEHLDAIRTNDNFKLVHGDITDKQFLNDFVARVKPSLFINCAAQSNILVSLQDPAGTLEATENSVTYCLEAILNYNSGTRFVTLGSCECFGSSPPSQNESTPMQMNNLSPYAQCKVNAYRKTIWYRDTHNLFASNALCFNSESLRRPVQYLCRKVSQAVCRIKLGLQDKLFLGNIESFRDFSHAADTADAVYRIVTADKPDDYVVASGESHTIREFVETAFNVLDLDWKRHVEIDSQYFRETNSSFCGDSTKLRTKLGWKPKYNFIELIDEMVKYDLDEIQKESVSG